MPNQNERDQVSIIIPVYNEEKRIEGLLRSILSQTVRDRIGEIIIVDDSSTDQTLQKIHAISHPLSGMPEPIHIHPDTYKTVGADVLANPANPDEPAEFTEPGNPYHFSPNHLPPHSERLSDATAISPSHCLSHRPIFCPHPELPAIIIIQQAHKTNRAKARNTGAAQACNPWLLFLDADMVIQNDYIERQLELFIRYPDTLAAIGKITPAIRQYSPYFHYYFFSPNRGTNRYGNKISEIRFTELLTQNLMIQTELFRHSGGFDESIHYGEDFVLAWRLKCLYPDRPYRFNPLAVVQDLGFTEMKRGLDKFRYQFRPNLLMILDKYSELRSYFPIANRPLTIILRMISMLPVNEIFYFSPELATWLFKARFMNALL